MNSTEKRRNYIIFHLPWQLFVIIIFILSSISQQDIPEFAEKISDKILHFVVFGILGVLVVRSFMASHYSLLKRYPVWTSMIFTSLYGVFDELHQKLVPGRTTSLADWAADTVGGLTFILIYAYFSQYRNNRKKVIPPGSETGPVQAGDPK